MLAKTFYMVNSHSELLFPSCTVRITTILQSIRKSKKRENYLLSKGILCVCLSTIILHKQSHLFSPLTMYTSTETPWASQWSVWQSATGMVCHFCVWAEAELSYVIQGGIRVRWELGLAGLSGPVSRLDDRLAQAGDPLLLAEGVIGLQAVRVSFGAPSAAHAETVLHWEMIEREKGREKGNERGEGREIERKQGCRFHFN